MLWGMKGKVTLVWDDHGGGRLVGIFDDRKTIRMLKRLVAESGQENYVRFSEVTVNEVLSKSFSHPPRASR